MQFNKYLSTVFLTGKNQNIYESQETARGLLNKLVKFITDEHDCLHEEIERKYSSLYKIKVHTSFEIFFT